LRTEYWYASYCEPQCCTVQPDPQKTVTTSNSLAELAYSP
jgi:hypothetical protein